MGKEKKVFKSFDELSKITKTQRDLTQYPGYKKHERYPEGVSSLDNVFNEESPDLDRWSIPWKKWDLIVAFWAKEPLSTSKSFSDNLQKSKSDIFSILDVYTPKHSENKIIRIADKINKLLDEGLRDINDKDVENFIKKVDLSKHMMENKIYKWIISKANKKWLTVCIWSQFWHTLEYDISYDSLPEYMKKKTFHKWLEVFVDIEKDSNKNKTRVNLVPRKAFDKPRFDALKNMNIEVGSKKPVFYKTKWWKLLKWTIIWLGDDTFGKQVVFQTKDGKIKFSIAIESLKEWIDLARKDYFKTNNISKRPNNKKTSDFFNKKEKRHSFETI